MYIANTGWGLVTLYKHVPNTLSVQRLRPYKLCFCVILSTHQRFPAEATAAAAVSVLAFDTCWWYKLCCGHIK